MIMKISILRWCKSSHSYAPSCEKTTVPARVGFAQLLLKL